MSNAKKEKRIVVGVVSDTHGPLSQRAASALRGVDHIIHAGDVVDVSTLKALQGIATLTAVRGNMDGFEVAEKLARTAVLETAGVTIYVLHDLSRIDLDPAAAGFQVVVHGHTHRAEIEQRDGVLYVNPGSARESTVGRVPTLARIVIENNFPNAQIVELD